MLLIRTLKNRARTAEQLRARFFAMQASLQPDIFIEAGAYDGTTSIEMRGILPKAKITAFEAHPTNFEHFSAQIQHRRADVDYVRCALAATDGEITFNVLVRSDGTPVPLSKKSSLNERSDGKRHIPVTVPARSLDSYLSDCPGRCSLWVDVEGATREVLRGAKETLKRTVSALVEVEDVRYWKDQWLAADVVSFMARHGLHPTARDYEYPHQYNLMFERR